VKYGIDTRNAVEFRAQFAKDIFVIGPHYWRNFNPKDKAAFFVGAEADYFTFEGEESKGWGLVVGGFAGAEYFIQHSFSVSADIGPAYISLKDKDTSQTEAGVDFVINLGLTYYFK
jgi:hypothetical protein